MSEYYKWCVIYNLAIIMSYCSPSNFLFSQLQECIINHMWSNIGTKCNSLTQQFIGISTTIDTWATCFDSIESSSGPHRLQIQFLQGSQVHCGIPSAYIYHITIDTWATCFDSIKSSSGPQRLQIQFLQGSQVHCGIPNAYIYHVSIGDPTVHSSTL